MNAKMTLGKFIAKMRKEAGLTQRELADRLYLTESAISKWERGLSFPDISLITPLCEALDISEHELITASEDTRQRTLEKQAKSFRTLTNAYSWIFYLLYGISLITCFICNLAVSHKLDWFFIVLTAEMVAFSLTSLPLLLPKHRGSITLLSFFLSLCLLLLACSIYTGGGSWLIITFIALLFGLSVIFLPLVLRDLALPRPFDRHKTLIAFTADTILLFALLAICSITSGTLANFFSTDIPVALLGLLFPWGLMVSIRYIPLNGLFRTAICLLFTGIYTFFINGAITAILDKAPFALYAFDLLDWSPRMISGNVFFLTLLGCIVGAVAFTIGGICRQIHRGRPEKL